MHKQPRPALWSLFRTMEVLRTLRANNSEAHILALGVLPRGWDDPWHVYVWPSMYRCGSGTGQSIRSARPC